MINIKQKSLAKNAFFNTIYKLLNVLFPFVISMYAARVLQPEGIGKVAYSRNIVSYFTLVASLGIPHYGIKEIAKYHDNQLQLNKSFSELFFINLFSTIICSLLYIFVIIGNQKSHTDFLLYLAVGTTLFFNIINVDWFYQGIESYKYIAVRSFSIKIISLICIFAFVRTREDYVVYALISSLATVLNYLWNIYNCRKHVSVILKNLNFMKHIKPIIYLLVVSISLEIYSKIDITMLGHFFTSENVGYYNIAQKTINVVLTMIISITAVFLPRLSSSYKTDQAKFKNLVRIGFHIVLFFSVPCFFGLLILGERTILLLYGNMYIEAVTSMKILSSLIIVKSFGDILCYQVLICSNNEKKLLFPNCFTALINIALNFTLIPIWKQNGAAVASVISEIILNISLFSSSSKIINLKICKKDFLSVFISALFMLITLFLISYINFHNSILSIIVQVVVGVIVYLSSTYLLGNTFINEFIKRFFLNHITDDISSY